MWEPFTPASRRAVMKAQEVAREMGLATLGSGALLVGILEDEEAVASHALRKLGVDPAEVRQQVRERSAHREPAPDIEVIFTPNAKAVIELAFEEARRLRHNYIGTEHILLGMLQRGDGVGFQVLTALGVDYERARTEIVALLGVDLASPEAPPEARGLGATPLSGGTRHPTYVEMLAQGLEHLAALRREVEALRQEVAALRRDLKGEDG